MCLFLRHSFIILLPLSLLLHVHSFASFVFSLLFIYLFLLFFILSFFSYQGTWYTKPLCSDACSARWGPCRLGADGGARVLGLFGWLFEQMTCLQYGYGCFLDQLVVCMNDMLAFMCDCMGMVGSCGVRKWFVSYVVLGEYALRCRAWRLPFAPCFLFPLL